MNNERKNEAERIYKLVRDRKLKISGDFGNHRIENHNGKIDDNCASCTHYQDVVVERDYLSFRLKNIEKADILKSLKGKKVLFIEQEQWLAHAEHLADVYGFEIETLDIMQFPQNLSTYCIENSISGVVAHLEDNYKFEDMFDQMCDVNQLGIKTTVIIPIRSLDSRMEEERKNDLMLNKIPYIVKDYDSYVGDSLVLLAGQFLKES